ncbi:MAG TPA: polyphosphate kinase 2 family protein [Gaiellaceae bacterium]|nr:polyphosphate kinase 2 family protein [Gaiellaceae bacterium]
METKQRIASLTVTPGKRANLSKRDPGDRLDLADREAGAERLAELVAQLSALHNRLWAESTRSVLIVLQGLDAAGKDGTIRQVFTGLNPQGCRAVSFKQPSSTELAHDYLWRVHAACPARGEIGIFNRSHYEDVVAVRVRGLAPARVLKHRPRQINEFEHMLADEGTTVVKVFLHVSRDKQRERLQERLEDPEKSWKFRVEDLDDRARWNDFMAAYEEVISQTSTSWAPWYVIPADRNWIRNLTVAEVLVHVLEQLDPQFPPPMPGLETIEIT